MRLPWLWLWCGACQAALLPPPPPSPSPPVPKPPPPSPLPPLELRGRRLVVVMRDTFTARVYGPASPWQRFAYRDGRVFDAFQQLTGFIPEVYPPSGCDYKNSSCSPLNDILSGVADITFNTDYLEPKGLTVDWGPAVHYGYTSVVTARGVRRPALEMLAQSVEVASVAALAASVAVGAVVLHLAIAAPRPSRARATMRVLALMASVPTHMPQPLKTTAARLVSIGCSLFSIVFVCFFQGVLVDNMTNARFEPPLESLEQLDASPRFAIVASSAMYARAVRGSDLPLLVRLNQRLTMRSEYQEDEVGLLEWLAERPSTAVLITHIAFRILAPITRGGPQSFHELQEHPSMYIEAYPSAVGSPWAERMRAVAGRLLQAGLIDRWYEESTRAFVNTFRESRRLNGLRADANYDAGRGAEAKTIGVDDFVPILLCVGVSYAAAVGVLLAEVVFHSAWGLRLRRELRSWTRTCL